MTTFLDISFRELTKGHLSLHQITKHGTFSSAFAISCEDAKTLDKPFNTIAALIRVFWSFCLLSLVEDYKEPILVVFQIRPGGAEQGRT